MSPDIQSKLSRRERQIMEIVYQLSRATVSEVIERMEDAPSYSAVRALMGILEDKGNLRHEQDGPRYVYLPVVAREAAQRSALKSLVKTFFNDSAREAIAALIDEGRLEPGELEELSKLIARAKKEGR